MYVLYGTVPSTTLCPADVCTVAVHVLVALIIMVTYARLFAVSTCTATVRTSAGHCVVEGTVEPHYNGHLWAESLWL